MLTQVLTLQEVPTYLARLTTPLESGKEILILRENLLLAKLVAPTLSTSDQLRTVDEYQGKIVISDDFYEPLPEEFWAGEIEP